MPLCAAAIVVVPARTPVASPEPLIVATAVLDEDHATWPVRSCVEPSEYLPVALNCCVAPGESEAFAGATVMEVSDTGGALVTETCTAAVWVIPPPEPVTVAV